MLLTAISSGLKSQRGIAVALLPSGSGSGSGIPGSRNGRAVPVTTTAKRPLPVALAWVSLTLPPVGATTVALGTTTRMPSRCSSWSRPPSGRGSSTVSATGAGRTWPADSAVTRASTSSVSGSWYGSAAGTYSSTVPCTSTWLPTAAASGGVVEVNTNRPSEVAGLPSSWPWGVCTKKPLLRRPVTMPLVATAVPARGERWPSPWIAEMASVATSSSRMVPMPWPSPIVAPAGADSSTAKVSSGSLAVSPATSTPIVTALAPSAMVTVPAAAL